MKKSFILSGLLAAAALMSTGCDKATPPRAGHVDPDLVSFSASGLSMEVSTKATEVTSSNLGTFNVIAASGATGSQAQVWNTTASKVGATDVWATDKYWPSTDQGYTSFYASNAALTFNAAGPTVSPADNSVDVVVAHKANPSYREQNALTFNHVFARVGSITLNTQSGYSLSNVSATLQSPVTGGTYNLRTQAWTPAAVSANQAMAAFSGTTSAQTSSNDYWLVPGDYTLSVSYRLTKGDYVEDFSKTGTVTLVQGKTNAITATALGGSASEIKFGVSVTAWSANNIALAWEPNANGHDYVDLGLRVGGNKILFATMNIGASSETDYGDYLAWGETSKRYTSISGNSITGATFEWSNAPYHTGSNKYTGWSKYIPTGRESYSISGTADNLLTLEASDDVASVMWGGNWRIPDRTELEYLFSSSVDSEWVSDYNGSGVNGYKVTGKGEFSSSVLFFPAAGVCDGSTRVYVDFGRYWSRSFFSGPEYPDILTFSDGGRSSAGCDRYCGLSVRPVLVVPE